MANAVFLIDGPIGAGKTELMRYLREHKEEFSAAFAGSPGAPAEPEESGLETILEHYDAEALKIYYQFREHSQEYNELFEKSQLYGRLWRIVQAKHGRGIYGFDRGMLSSIAVFTENACEEGNLTLQARERIYDDVRRGIDMLGRKKPHDWLEQVVLYMRVWDPEILMQRQKKRKVDGETIPLEYHQHILQKYDRFYGRVKENYQKFSLPAPAVVTVDASPDFGTDKVFHARLAEMLKNTLQGVLNERKP